MHSLPDSADAIGAYTGQVAQYKLQSGSSSSHGGLFTLRRHTVWSMWIPVFTGMDLVGKNWSKGFTHPTGLFVPAPP